MLLVILLYLLMQRRSTGQEPLLTHPSYKQKRGEETGPKPVDRGLPDCKHHVLTDMNGILLVVALTAANVHMKVLIVQMKTELAELRVAQKVAELE